MNDKATLVEDAVSKLLKFGESGSPRQCKPEGREGAPDRLRPQQIEDDERDCPQEGDQGEHRTRGAARPGYIDSKATHRRSLSSYARRGFVVLLSTRPATATRTRQRHSGYGRPDASQISGRGLRR